MKDKKEINPHAVSPKVIVIMIGIVLVGVFLGSMLALNRADKAVRTRFDQPPRLGHVTPQAASAIDTNEMVWIPAGTFVMGSEDGQSDERPVHPVAMDGFWMDQYEVTNEKFEKFVRATGYVTIAERKPDPKDFPGADPSMLVPGSVVFSPPPGDVPLYDHSA